MEIKEATKIIKEKLGTDEADATRILGKAIAGGEITKGFGLEKWLHGRFLPNCVFVDEDGYSKMCVDALKILSLTAATDYGSSRQRDMGQLWADMTRGYLGELAFILFLEQKWGIKAELGHEAGALEDFLPEDIKQIKKKNEPARPPKLKLGIKTTKWNGIWLDIPGGQFNHSDIHVLVKVGAGRDHLFAFFKKLSVFKDKVLKRGQEVGVLTEDAAKELFDKLPSFKPIPAYICGFAPKNGKYSDLCYSGKKGRKHYKVQSWNGPINPGDMDTIKEREGISGNVNFEGIGSFAHDKGYLFNTGNLLWQQKDWKNVIDKI